MLKKNKTNPRTVMMGLFNASWRPNGIGLCDLMWFESQFQSIIQQLWSIEICIMISAVLDQSVPVRIFTKLIGFPEDSHKKSGNDKKIVLVAFRFERNVESNRF